MMTTKRTNGTDRTINVLLPGALHRQLRQRALNEDLTVKDATIAAIEAWVAPAAKHQAQAPTPIDQEPDRAQAALDTIEALWQALRIGAQPSAFEEGLRAGLGRGEPLKSILANLSISGTIET